MSHRRISKRKAILAGAGAVGVAAAAILLPNANASQPGSGSEARSAPKKLSASLAAPLVQELGEKLGDSYGGAYYDADKQQLVVNVVGGDDDNVIEVKKAGAVARNVENSTKELKAAAGTLAEKATIPGTAWAVDPKTNQILVTADSTVTGGRWDTLESTVESLGGGMARIQKSEGTFKPFAVGGEAIFGGSPEAQRRPRCSLGFNVTTKDGSPGFLTAGHCVVDEKKWAEDASSQPTATVEKSTFPGDGDFALVKYDDPKKQVASTVDLGGKTVDIKQAAEATVGQEVSRTGSTTGVKGGKVTGLDATVNYREGSVTGVIQTDVCAEGGDSGGPLFTQDGSALGLTSGGSGDCTRGGVTFFQPVTTALKAVDAKIGDGDGGAGNGGAGNGGAENGGAENGGQKNGGQGNGGAENGGQKNGGAENGGAENGGAENGGAENGGAENGGAGNGGAENGGQGDGGKYNGGAENGGQGDGGKAGGAGQGDGGKAGGAGQDGGGYGNGAGQGAGDDGAGAAAGAGQDDGAGYGGAQ
ncbi:S1 family peptidase [Streptomyces sp. NBC_00829]|uniref:S1 family peptidase n=1 Tax=Streptomyces sp. NBC_00829 TaxID=2903679 RepID=UPI00386330ED|nr:S1 family peptidase [Streptomyces sp. NBC_00829]